LLVPPDNVDALTGAIRQMLLDRELRHSLGRQARKHAVENFALSTAAARVRSFWESYL